MAKQPRAGKEAKSPIYKRLWFAIAVAVAAGLLTLTFIGWLWGEGGIFSLRRIFSFWLLDLHAIDKAEYIKSALALVGGIGGVVYLVVKYRERAAAERDEARADRKEAEERLLAAVQQLGSESPQVRIAGVYALADIADTYLGDYKQRVVNILCGYLRTKRGEFVKREPEEALIEDANVETADTGATSVYESDDGPVEATIIDVFSRHLRKNSAPSKYTRVSAAESWNDCLFDLHGTHFIEAALFEYCAFKPKTSFANCHFHNNAVFDGSTFEEHASFIHSNFRGQAHFIRATFDRTANFEYVNFCAEARFDHSTFEGSATFSCSRFGGATIFHGSKFHSGTNFRQCEFSRTIYEKYMTIFTQSQFGNLKLGKNELPEGARWDNDSASSDDDTDRKDPSPNGAATMPLGR